MDYELIKTTLQGRGLDLWQVPKEGVNTMESKIIPLVAVLNYFGYKTSQSCEGHSLAVFKKRAKDREQKFPNEPVTVTYEDAHIIKFEIDKSKLPPPYAGAKVWKYKFDESPWVLLNLPNEDKVHTLDEIIQAYNKESSINWNLRRLNTQDNYYNLAIKPQYSFEEMQQDIMKFTEFLHNQLFLR